MMDYVYCCSPIINSRYEVVTCAIQRRNNVTVLSLYNIWFFAFSSFLIRRSSKAFALESDDVKHVAVALYHDMI